MGPNFLKEIGIAGTKRQSEKNYAIKICEDIKRKQNYFYKNNDKSSRK